MIALRKSLNLLFVLCGLIFSQSSVFAQCSPNAKYDKLVSGYHSSMALTSNDSFKVWGQTMHSNGSTNLTAPITLNVANYPALTGTPLKVALGGQGGGGKDQFLLLTTTGIFAWGPEGMVLDNALTASTTFAKIVAPTGSDTATRLPLGVTPSHVAMFYATNQTLAILTDSGNVWILTQASTTVQGDSSIKSTTTWHKVKKNASTYLDKVIAIRGNVDDSTKNSFLALTSEGKIFAWGATVFPGGGAARITAKYARELIIPAEFGPANVPKMIAVTGGSNDSANTNPTYFIVSYFGGLYCMGDNRQKQCGDFTRTERLNWVKARFSVAASDTFKNVSNISVQEHTAAFPAIAVITDTGNLYAWGDNSSNMLGSATAGDLDPHVPGGFTPGTDKAVFAETGGHTLVYVKQGSTQFCYVGHATSGSAGNTDNTTYSSFNCSTTPVVAICGAVPVVASTATSTISASPTSIVANGSSTSTITVQLKTAAGVNLTSSGGVVGMSTSFGTISSVTDNNDGTYTATLTSPVTVSTATISFTVNGYSATNTTTVNFTTMFCAPAITGTASMCVGAGVTLSNTSSGGTWTSTTPAVATINSTTGAVTGVAAGTSTITYALASGCLASVVVTVNAAPAAITGTLSSCAGGNSTLSNTSTGGTWTSGNTSVATVGSSSGIVAAVAAGTAAITYTLSGCSVSSVFTVNSSPSAITGTLVACVGGGNTLSNSTSGGTWTSGATSVATVGSASGVVAAVAAGTAGITYTAPSGCSVSAVYTVNALPAAITGTKSICMGSSTTLTNSTSGGTWTSGNTSVATIGSASGVVTSVATGTSIITYTVSGGCTSTTTVTVNAMPSAISGSMSACAGASSTLGNSISGGTWSSTNTSVATVGSGSGVVSAVAAGTATISYTLSTGCAVGAVFTVNAVPASITGTLSACIGGSSTLSNTTSGGTWSSANTAVATVGSGTGVVTALTVGTSAISYTLSTGCSASAVYTVNSLSTAITGTLSACAGGSSTLSNTTTGGTWASSNTSVATIGSASGVVSAVSAGTATMTYTSLTGCAITSVFTVNALPSAISGTLFMCQGSNTTLSSATTGGTWSSSNTAVATVGTGGVVNGVLAGNATITYTAGGCSRTAVVTVGVVPAAISGAAVICYHQSATLSSTPSGQTWTSGNTSVATINSSTGVVYGESVGTATITYTNSNSCYATTIVTVSTGPNTGDDIVCVGSTVTLSNATTGGTWSSSNSNATVNSSTGLVTGVVAGVANISYSVPSGCVVVTAVTVNPAMDTIAGQRFVCLGTTSSLTHTTAGGTWTSSNATVASVNSVTGAVYGAGIGTANITYTVSSGCIKVTQVTVNSTLPAITGYSYICVGGGARQFTHPLGGGTWSSSNTAVATVGTTGLVTPVGPGMVTVTYTLVAGCSVTFDILVNLLPPSISGPSQVCVGQSAGLYSVIGGSATWSSSDVSVATIGSGDGTVTGIAPGTATITYAYYGCFLTRVQTVNEVPAAITGSASMCAGQATVFSTTPAGGSWTSSNTSVATVNASTGVVTAVVGGSTVITYIMPSGCYAAMPVTVGNTPAALTGDHVLCVGNSAALTTTTTGGTWSSGDNTIATVSASGVVTGIGAGVTGISYTHPVSGCVRVAMTTVNAAVAANVGNNFICEGGTTTLTNATSGGYWTSNNLAAATVNSSTGVVTAVAPGYAAINYVVSSSCYATTNLTVNSMPAAITGNTTVCQGYTSTLSHPVSGGTWTSNNVAIATVGSSTGVVTGIGLGPVAITYTTSSGCFRTVTVNVGVVPSPITGTNALCTGSTTTLSTIVGGSGTWSSSDTTIATVNTYGTVAGLVPGTATITYTVASSLCYVTKVVSVNLSPAAITGNTNICSGNVDSSFACSPSGGTWSSSNTSAATVNAATGVITGISAGAANISYNLSTGCRSIKAVTINALPSAITGALTACVGSTTALGSATTGASWSSSNTAVGTVSASGVVAALSSGTTTVSYTNASGCASTAVVTVNNVPAAISGNLNLCMGSTSTLTNTVSGGTWTSSNTAVATVGAATGLVTPVATGTANVTYTVSGMGCYTVAQVTVNSALAAITGTTNVCVGTATTLSYSPAGGVWSSSDSSKATINAATGVVTGIAPGTITITYSFSSACYKTATFTVKALPVITGTAAVCASSSITLTSSPAGGAWSSSDVSKAVVSATSGLVTGVSAGTAIISYLSGGCYGVATVTVNQLPDPITGSAGVCVGTSSTLVGYPSGGSWLSSVVAKATVDASTGVVTGVATGTSTISYTLATGCRRTTIVTVGAMPNVVTGTTNVCVGSTTTLTTTTAGGTWSSANAAIATTGTAATTSTVVTGISTGTTIISYTALGCSRLTTVNVTSPIATIVGDSSMCVGSATTMTTTTTGGTWVSSNATIATVGSLSGVTSAIAGGSVTITYRTGPTCYTTKQITVNTTLPAISGNTNACVGYPTTLTHPMSGGVWSSSNTARATVDAATGVVMGISNGSVIITYALSSGCYKTVTVIVNNLPLPITGTATVCEQNVTIYSTVTGSSGTWSSADTTIATSAPTIGTVTGVSSGVTNITYTATTGCFVIKDVTVLPTPAVITGPSTACTGSSIALSSVTPGGTWSSNNLTAATVGSTSGVVTAVGGGNAVISYIMPNACRRIMTITVNVQPAAITGPGVVCMDNTITLASATAGLTWSSSNTSVATVGSLTTTTAAVTPVSSGAATISYTNTVGCSRTYTVTVNGAVSSITGGNSVCTGQTVALASTTTGGTWSSSSTAKAGIDAATGVVTGVAAGTANITYLVNAGCYKTLTMSVNTAPAAITGLSSVVAGSSTTLACTTTGGAWSSSNTAIGVVGGTTGVVTGVSAGTVTISYVISATGCRSVKAMTVNPLPLAKGVSPSGSNEEPKFVVFPNPTQGILTVESSVYGTFTMYTIDGKQLSEYRISKSSETIHLPSDLAVGVYMFRFKGDDESVQVLRLIYKP